MPKDWNKIQAQWTVAGVILATALSIVGLWFMWWLDQRHSNASAGDAPVTPIAWWMPTLIVAGMVMAGLLHYRAVVKAKTTEQPHSPDLLSTPEAQGRMAADTAAMYHWKGMAEGNAEELKYAHEAYKELSTASSGQIDKLNDELTKLKASLQQERLRKRPLVERAGAIRSKAGQAEWLNGRLEEIWHMYDADKKANESLMYPLSTSVIPDEIKEWRHKQLWAFRVLYQSHIGAVKAIDPDFHSNLIDDGFPRDGEDYLSVRRKIGNHAALLRDRADRLIRADAEGEAL